MEKSKFSSEVLVEIWNDKNGEKVEVGPDRDGVGLIEIRSYDINGKLCQSICCPPEQMSLIAEAIEKIVKEKA